jgi:hypothetical protein
MESGSPTAYMNGHAYLRGAFAGSGPAATTRS